MSTTSNIKTYNTSLPTSAPWYEYPNELGERIHSLQQNPNKVLAYLAELVLFRACKRWGIVELKDLELIEFPQILDISHSIYGEVEKRGYSIGQKARYRLKETLVKLFCPLFCECAKEGDCEHEIPSDIVIPKVSCFRYNSRFGTPEAKAIAKALLDVGVNPFYTADELAALGYRLHTQNGGVQKPSPSSEHGERGTIEIYLYKSEGCDEYNFISRIVGPN